MTYQRKGVSSSGTTVRLSNRPSPLSALRRRLDLGEESMGLTVVGDSTGNESDEWVYNSLPPFLDDYPDYEVTYRVWNGTAEAYGVQSVLQAGTAGDSYLTCDGATNRAFSATYNARQAVTGDQVLIFKMQADAGHGTMIPAAREGGGGNRAIWVEVLATGRMVLDWTVDGTTILARTSTANIDWSTSPLWGAVYLDVDNGAAGHTVHFYTSTDGITWTASGSPVVTAGTTSVFASTSGWTVGSRSGVSPVKGKLYHFEHVSGSITAGAVSGTIVAAADVSEWRDPTAAWVDPFQNTWTANSNAISQGRVGARSVAILNGSHPGAGLAYLSDATRLAKMTPAEPAVVFVNDGLNDSGHATFRTTYKAYLDDIRVRWPFAGFALLAQNPKTAPELAADIAGQDRHMGQLHQIASVADGVVVIDFHKAITDTGSTATYVDSDGVHLTAAGKTLAAATVLAALRAA